MISPGTSVAAPGFCKGILFDFGGTLDSDGEHWLDRVYALYESAGLHVAQPEIKRAFYLADSLCEGDARVALLGLRPLMRHHFHLQFEALSLGKEDQSDLLAEAFCARSEASLRESARVLARLRERYRLGLVSNFYGNLSVVCAEAGLSDSLDVILDSGKAGVRKPDREIFERALEGLHLPPEEVVFVGDSYERDIAPAGRMGMKTIWVKGPRSRIVPHSGPVDLIISRLMELEGVLL